MVFYFHFRVLSSILSLSFLCSSVSEALFTLSFSYLSERFFFVHDKAALVEINNTGVTGQSLPPKNDFEHARGLRNSAYAVNLTYETYRHYTYTRNVLLTAQMGERASVVLICIITSRYNEVK